MSNLALTWAWGLELKSGPKIVLLALADMADSEGSCFPGIPLLSKMTGLSESGVRSNLQELLKMRLLTAERRTRRDGSRTSNRYWLSMGGSAPLAPESDARPDDPNSQNPGGQAPESGGPSARIRGGILEPPVEPKGEPSEVARVPRANTPTTAEVNRAWEAFWEVYPRKVGKPKAYESFKRALRRASVVDIIDGAARYRNDPNREDAFTAHPTTWLNRDGWNDEPLPAPAAKRGSVEDMLRRADAMDAADRARASDGAGGYNWEEAARRKELGA